MSLLTLILLGAAVGIPTALIFTGTIENEGNDSLYQIKSKTFDQ
jgi:hypothetical protein